MSTNAQIVAGAFLEHGIPGAGSSLSTADQTKGLTVLDRLYHRIAAFDTGYPWIDVVGENGYVAGEDERIRCATAVTITYPDHVEFDGTGTDDTFDEDLHRPPLDGARVQVIVQATNANTLKFYRTDRGAWVEATATDTDQCPFGEHMDHYLIAMLAEALAGQYPGSLTDFTRETAREGWRAFRSRYARPSAPVEAAFY